MYYIYLPKKTLELSVFPVGPTPQELCTRKNLNKSLRQTCFSFCSHTWHDISWALLGSVHPSSTLRESKHKGQFPDQKVIMIKILLHCKTVLLLHVSWKFNIMFVCLWMSGMRCRNCPKKLHWYWSHGSVQLWPNIMERALVGADKSMLSSTGSSRKNVKSKSVCTGVNVHKKWFLRCVLGWEIATNLPYRTSGTITITMRHPS